MPLRMPVRKPVDMGPEKCSHPVFKGLLPASGLPSHSEAPRRAWGTFRILNFYEMIFLASTAPSLGVGGCPNSSPQP